jgi:hypothetical protein
MKKAHKTTKTTKPDHLGEWVTDERFLEYMGITAGHKIAVLAAVMTRGNVSAVARQWGISKEAACRQARRARQIFGVNAKLT